MQFTQRSIQNFKRLYLQEFGEEISESEVVKRATYLLEVYRVVFGLPSIEEIFDNRINNEETE